MNLTFVSYWWGSETQVCENTSHDFFKGRDLVPVTYSKMAENMKTNMKKMGLSFHVEHLDFKGVFSYQDCINYKPIFIKKMLKLFKGPVVYIDIDMRIHAKPVLFTDTDGFYDFMAFNWNADQRVSSIFDWLTLETSGGLMYFNNTKPALDLLDAWESVMKSNRNRADDRGLSMAFSKTDSVHALRFYWFPLEYFYVPQYFGGVVSKKSVVISHPMSMSCERKVLKGLKINTRVPSDYKRIVSSRVRHRRDMTETRVPFRGMKRVTKKRNSGLVKILNIEKFDQRVLRPGDDDLCVNRRTLQVQDSTDMFDMNDIYLWSSFRFRLV